MSKNNQEHRDSTTDFFLNFISKEKEHPISASIKKAYQKEINQEDRRAG